MIQVILNFDMFYARKIRCRGVAWNRMLQNNSKNTTKLKYSLVSASLIEIQVPCFFNFEIISKNIATMQRVDDWKA